MYTKKICLIILIVLTFKTIIAVFDLNRTPSPEPPERQISDSSTAKLKRKAISQLKRSSNAPGVQARAMANAPGYAKNTKEYQKLYFHHYHKIRNQQKEEFYKGKVEDPQLALKQEKERKRASTKEANLARKERKRTGNLTPSDKTFYERCRKWQIEYFRKNPELKIAKNEKSKKQKKAKWAKESNQEMNIRETTDG